MNPTSNIPFTPVPFSSFVPPFELGANRSASGGPFLFRLEFGSKF